MSLLSSFFAQVSSEAASDAIESAVATSEPVLSTTQMYAYGAFILICLVVVLAFWKKTALGSVRLNKGQNLKISEMRVLGNKQYLAIVEYEDKKILLGVSPGLIQHLGHLDGSDADRRSKPEANDLEKLLQPSSK